ncbi:MULTISPECIES: GntR family transcriptional regulator [Shouchella]|uniref:GntR family transcriptional regulator n=2 Tax=Shouchella TaxID=2893057 RepID=A0ABY7WAA1_9BACI|nr:MULTISPECIES: GntR family transcriptional regulator [Shouchella]MED4130223.1 GntR family transcriptional regulator [Shouchella miscanthi]WDF04483.1 GntR family transcriptional regulator [Shouchella hunanensis]GAF23752.1 transcriptional regulator, GntR family [Bacillus sp. JCM 19047]
MNILFNNREPVYIQVIRHFKEQIALGHLVAGQEIPSRRELGSTLKINPNTAQRAYKEMEEQQLIETERNKPSRITQDQEILNQIRAELIHESVDLFLDSMKTINVSVDELISIIRNRYEDGGTSHDSR